jgi:hypothetical protein
MLRIQDNLERLLGAAGINGASRDDDRAPIIITARQTNAGLNIYCPFCNKTSRMKNERRGKQ